MKRRLAALALGSALAAFMAVGTGAEPASAATCSGYTCHGYDYRHFSCTYSISTSAAAVDYRTGVIVGYVYNRYSAGCKSNWTEAQLTPAGYAAGDTLYAETFTTDSQGKSEVMYSPTAVDNRGLTNEPGSTPYRGTSTIYTDMVDGTNLVHSVALVYSGQVYVSAGSGESVQ